jgi:fructose transport system permease protein
MSTTDITPEPTTARPGVLDVARRIVTAPTASALLALVLTAVFFSLKTDRFLQTQNLSLVLQQVMVVGVLAIGQTLVILTAGIDLSVGTVMAFGQIVMTKLAVANGVHPLLAIALGILACVAFGSSSRWARSTSPSR